MQVTRVAPGWPVPSLMPRRRVMADRITYVGLDVHKESIVVAVAAGGLRGGVREYGRIANTAAALDRLMRKLGGEVARPPRAGRVTAVSVPALGHEAMRALVPARPDAVHALRRAGARRSRDFSC